MEWLLCVVSRHLCATLLAPQARARHGTCNKGTKTDETTKTIIANEISCPPALSRLMTNLCGMDQWQDGSDLDTGTTHASKLQLWTF